MLRATGFKSCLGGSCYAIEISADRLSRDSEYTEAIRQMRLC